MHPSDGALRAMLDEWSDPLDQADLERHVIGCERCRQQMARLAHRRLVVDLLLQELEVPVPTRSIESIVRRAGQRRSRRRALIAAAAGLFVVSVAGATIRTNALHQALRWFSPPPSAQPAAPRTVEPRRDGSTEVALEPSRDVRIEFAAAQ